MEKILCRQSTNECPLRLAEVDCGYSNISYLLLENAKILNVQV